MSQDHEEVFAQEAQEDALLSRTESYHDSEPSTPKKNNVRTETVETDDALSESSPLISSSSDVRQRQKYQRAGTSYQRALDEPWTGAHGQGDLPWYKKPSIYWLLPAFFPFAVAFGGLLVPKTYLVLDLICRDYLSGLAEKDPSFQYLPVLLGQENQQCRIPEVQRIVSYFNIGQDLLSGGFAALVAPSLGALSDRIGRKKVIVIGTFGALLTEVITIIIAKNPDTVSVWWLLVGAFADGLCGSFTTILALSFAYASDCTTPQQRAVAFGKFHGALFGGIALGPLVAGGLMKLTGGILVVFYFAVACHLFFILFTAFAVPESLSKARQVVAREKYAKRRLELSDDTWLQTVRKFNIFEPLWVLWPTGAGSSPALRRNLLTIAAIDTMMFGVAMGTMRIILIYAEFRYDFSAVDSSLFLSACNFVRIMGLFGLLPLLTRIFRNPTHNRESGHRGSNMLDINIIRSSITFDLLGYLGYALSPTGAFMVLSGVVAAIGGIGSPTLQSALTKHVPADKTGQILGTSSLLHALARVVAPLIFNLIYAKTVGWYSGFVFLCLASIFVIVFILSWFLKTGVYLEEQSNIDENQHLASVDPIAS